MRRLNPALLSLLATAAVTAVAAPVRAADLPAAPSYTPPAFYQPVVYNWTGIYFGGHVGAGLSYDQFTATTTVLEASGTQTSVNPYAFIGGAQVGANYQFAPWVVGIEGTYSVSDISGSAIAPTTLSSIGVTQRSTGAPKWFATAAARVGYAANDLLFYAKGGVAWMQADYIQDVMVGGAVSTTQIITDTRTGFLVGAGIEYGMTENLSAKIEYDFLGFGTATYDFNNLSLNGVPQGSMPISVQSDVQMFTVGLNYRFALGGR
jgi:outer membrane immunogenic protein